MVYPLTVAKIVGTDIFHAAALLWVAGIGHLVFAASFVVGAALFVPWVVRRYLSRARPAPARSFD